jgi:hypothetical protein
MYSFCSSGFRPLPSGITIGAFRYRNGLVRKSVIVVKKRVDELRNEYSHGRSGRGYRVEATATAAQNIAIRKHHNNIEPSMPPQIAVIL